MMWHIRFKESIHWEIRNESSIYLSAQVKRSSLAYLGSVSRPSFLKVIDSNQIKALQTKAQNFQIWALLYCAIIFCFYAILGNKRIGLNYKDIHRLVASSTPSVSDQACNFITCIGMNYGHGLCPDKEETHYVYRSQFLINSNLVRPYSQNLERTHTELWMSQIVHILGTMPCP